MFQTLAAIGGGAVLGAWARWWLGLRLNALWPSLPPGTLVANLLGGYLIGVVLAYLAVHSELAPQWRLFLVTGFLGALTTFSTFSAEVVGLLQAGQWTAAMLAVSVHVLGTLAMTLAGLGSVRWLLG